MNAFLEINDSGDSLVIHTDDLDLDGIYSVYYSSVLDEDDSTTFTASFVLTLIDPCDSTVIDSSFNIPMIVASVKGGSVDFVTIRIEDTASNIYGPDLDGTTFCG